MPIFLSVCGPFDDPKANEQLTFITYSDSKHTRTQTNKWQTHGESFVSSHYQIARTQSQDPHTHTLTHRHTNRTLVGQTKTKMAPSMATLPHGNDDGDDDDHRKRSCLRWLLRNY